jgi:hypothetical protein
MDAATGDKSELPHLNLGPWMSTDHACTQYPRKYHVKLFKYAAVIPFSVSMLELRPRRPRPTPDRSVHWTKAIPRRVRSVFSPHAGATWGGTIREVRACHCLCRTEHRVGLSAQQSVRRCATYRRHSLFHCKLEGATRCPKDTRTGMPSDKSFHGDTVATDLPRSVRAYACGKRDETV